MSKTQKTWIKIVSNIRKQIKYSFTWLFGIFQLISIHVVINHVVNIIKNNDIPSRPIVYWILYEGNHSAV